MARNGNKQRGNRRAALPQEKRLTFRDALLRANRRAEERANRRTGRRDMRSVWAAVDTHVEREPAIDIDPGFLKRILLIIAGLIVLPLAWVTCWTLLWRFSETAANGVFWRGTEFVCFFIGVVLMTAWFASGLAKRFFLYLYVLGHELTHVFFVTMCLGRVSDFHVSAEGGYVTTNKSNILIALSPYFVPFWAVFFGVIYSLCSWLLDTPEALDHWFYGVMGATWTFHLAWTLWMLPRDQPDLRENGTFFSLVVIFLANVLILAVIFCAASDDPLRSAAGFSREWVRHAVNLGEQGVRWSEALAGYFLRELSMR